jgi:hypothetical protein
MSISELFEQMGAPLNNVRWSWGAVRQADGAVFLRVWEDEIRIPHNKVLMRLTANRVFQVENPRNLGYRERARHVQLVKDGAPLFMVICRAQDRNEHPRTIAWFNAENVFRGGAITEFDGEFWAELGEAVPVPTQFV